MAISIPSISELQQRIANDLILAVNAGQTDRTKQIDPSIKGSFARGFVNSFAAGFDENNDAIIELLKQLFPQTATGDYLDRWAAFFGITRRSAVQATGSVVFTGTATTLIPASTSIIRSNGLEYITDLDATITASTLSISSLTRSGSTVTATTASDHNLATGVYVTIAGAVQTDYNGLVQITVTSSTTFTYTISASPSTPATGTITAAIDYIFTDITAVEYGSDENAAAGTQLTLDSPITNVDDIARVTFAGITGGINLETDSELRARLQERTANFSAPFSVSGLPVFIKENNVKVTRVWIQAATPSAGYVTIYFTQDNESSIIPSASDATSVKNTIIDTSTGIKPANTPDSYVIVNPPTAVPIDFTFTALSPNTANMQTAITNTLTDYFKSDSVILETDITANEYNSLLYSVVDSDGNSPTFTLSAPSGTVSISTGELATLGTITFP